MRILINNAAIGCHGALTESSLERVATLIRLNIASLAVFYPMAAMAVYASSILCEHFFGVGA